MLHGMARIVILGGGFGGFYTARELERLLAGRHEAVLVSDENFFLFTPLLPEAASGAIEPRHVVVPLRSALKRTRVVVGAVDRIDTDGKSVTVSRRAGADLVLPYDELVVALGSVPRFLDIPGVAQRAYGFKTLAEGIWLRNHVLEQLELADAETDEYEAGGSGSTLPPAQERRARLTFVIVGAGYAGIEAAAEMLDLCRAALRFYPGLRAGELRWIVIEAANAILPEIGPELSAYALARLRDKGMDIRLQTRIAEARDGAVVLSSGEVLGTRTLVWTAGVAANPLVAALHCEHDKRGRIVTSPTMQVPALDGVWSLGDCAAVPDARDEGRPAPPTAQHAMRQARRLAKNLAAKLTGRALQPFAYGSLGMLAGLGLYDGIGRLFGRIKIRGFIAWWAVRTYHLAMLPTIARKLRVVLDWTVALLFPRDIASLGSLGHAAPPAALPEVTSSSRDTARPPPAAHP